MTSGKNPSTVGIFLKILTARYFSLQVNLIPNTNPQVVLCLSDNLMIQWLRGSIIISPSFSFPLLMVIRLIYLGKLCDVIYSLSNLDKTKNKEYWSFTPSCLRVSSSEHNCNCLFGTLPAIFLARSLSLNWTLNYDTLFLAIIFSLNRVL